MKQLATILVLFSTLGAHGGELKLTETDDTIRITLRGKPVLEYVKTASPVPEGIAKHYSRSGYIHPSSRTPNAIRRRSAPCSPGDSASPAFWHS